mgnify:CR=1 FL=1
MKAQFKYTSQIVTYGQEVKKAFDKGMGAASGKLAAPISKKEVWLDLEIKSVYSLQRPEQALRQPEEYARP